MSGEKNLEILLKNMKPQLNPGNYVFCTVLNFNNVDLNKVIGSFHEKEGITLILNEDYAKELGYNMLNIMSWITLQVHSSLEAVGLTAAFSNVLAKNKISCNVVAGYYHDHIFVPKEDADKAMDLLCSL
jgi:hypothetical protein